MDSEHIEQSKFVMWWRQSFPNVRIFAIPNGGLRNKTTAMKLKVEGVKRGVPDLFVPELLLWIEMKREKGGVLSPDQVDWREYLEGIGHNFIVGNGSKDAQEKASIFIKL